MCRQMFVKPFTRRLCSSHILKTLGQKEKLLKNKQFLLLPQSFQLFTVIKPSFTEHYWILPRCFQSRLLQICCMWERVNNCTKVDFPGAPFMLLLSSCSSLFSGSVIVRKTVLKINVQFRSFPN